MRNPAGLGNLTFLTLVTLQLLMCLAAVDYQQQPAAMAKEASQ
jgi:hypothetical protein